MLKKLTLHSHSVTVDFNVEDKPNTTKAGDDERFQGSQASIDADRKLRAVKIDTAASTGKQHTRRPSLLDSIQSVRFLRKKSVVNTASSVALHTMTRLDSRDISPRSTLDPRSLAGLVDSRRLSDADASTAACVSTYHGASLDLESSHRDNLASGVSAESKSAHSLCGWPLPSTVAIHAPSFNSERLQPLQASNAIQTLLGSKIPQASPLTLAVTVRTTLSTAPDAFQFPVFFFAGKTERDLCDVTQVWRKRYQT